MMRFFVLLLLIFYSSCNFAETTKIKVWESLYNNPDSLFMDYLDRALQLTVPEYGSYELIASPAMEQGRVIIELKKMHNPKLDLATFATTKERENQAIPILIPLLNGLMGYRLCLIDKKRQTVFNSIESKQQLVDQNITIGQHQDWPDTTILHANNIKVKTSHKKKLLFKQLTRGRFDCFSRGASEIYMEYLTHQTQGIAIEKHLLLHYPLPIFFFVSKSRPLLAQRIQLGLEKLIATGEFETLFNNYFFPILGELNLNERAIIDLHNPTLSKQTIETMKLSTLKFRKKYL